MPDFEGTKPIFLQPSDKKVPYSFEYTVCSATTANDGSLPWGHTLASVITSVHREDAGIADIVSASSVTGQVHTIWISYPATVPVYTGKYHLTFVAIICDLTGTTAYVREFDFNRVIVRNL